MSLKYTVDRFLDPYVPRSIVPRLPSYISRWLGGHKPKTNVPDPVIWLDIFIGSFVSVLLIEGVFLRSGIFRAHHAPVIFASYGATAVLAFNAIQVPLAQPRNILGGHVIGAIIGCCVQKLFGLSQTGRDHYYVGGALSMALSSVVMSLTNTVHPPAGASALIPLIDEDVRKMSWWYIPDHIISSVLMIAVACITNNVLRKYPTHWWTAYTKPNPHPDEEKVVEPLTTGVSTKEDSDQTVEFTREKHSGEEERKIVITFSDVILPEALQLNTEEMEFLQNIRTKLM